MSDIPEQAGKVATGAIDALKGSPALLVLVLLQVMQMGVIYFFAQHNQERMQEREIALLNRCFPPSHDRSSRNAVMP